MKRFVILCWVIAASATALILFQIKQDVRVLEEQIVATQRAILTDQEAVHVLEAEWSYLNNPARVGALAERHLGLAPIPGERIVGFEDLPLPGAPNDSVPTEPGPKPDSPATLVKAPAEQLGALQP